MAFSMIEARDVSGGAARSSASCSVPEGPEGGVGASSRCHEGIDFAFFSLIAYLVMDDIHICIIAARAQITKRLDLDKKMALTDREVADHRNAGSDFRKRANNIMSLCIL